MSAEWNPSNEELHRLMISDSGIQKNLARLILKERDKLKAANAIADEARAAYALMRVRAETAEAARIRTEVVITNEKLALAWDEGAKVGAIYAQALGRLGNNPYRR